MVAYLPVYNIEFADADAVRGWLKQLPIDQVIGLMETIAAFVESEYCGDSFEVYRSVMQVATRGEMPFWSTDPDDIVGLPERTLVVNKVEVTVRVELG